MVIITVWQSGGSKKVVENYLKENELTAELKNKIIELRQNIESRRHQIAETRKWVNGLNDLLGDDNLPNPPVAGEAWSEQAIADITAANEEARKLWTKLFRECQKASGSAPSEKWLKAVKPILEKSIPRLRIAAKCSFEDKFLIVKDDLQSYKIHLGSGNILMLPNDQ